jgi:hypothetical protein
LPLTVRARAKGAVAPGGSSGNALVVAAVAAALLVLVVGAGLWVQRLVRRGWDPVTALRDRRRRRRRRPAPDPTAEVLAQWGEAATVLERARLGRRPAETLQEHASRLRSLVGAKWLMPYRPVTDGVSVPTRPGAATAVTIDASIEAYVELAALAARASYGSDPCTPEEAADAGHLGALVHTGLARSGSRRGAPGSM